MRAPRAPRAPSRRRRPSLGPWYLFVLGAAAAAVVIVGIVEIGPPTSSARTSTEIVQAADGVVQATVSGSGNVEAGTDVTVNFDTSGTLQYVYVSVGQHVTKGELLATLNPAAEKLALEQADEQLTAAQDELTEVEDGTASSSSSSPSSSGQASLTGVDSASSEFVAYTPTTTTPTTTTPTTTTPTTSTPTSTRPSGSGHSGGGSSRTGGGHTRSGSTSTTSTTGSSTGTSTTKTPSPSSVASAEASLDSAEESVRSAKTALAETRLRAPTSGTIVSLSSTAAGQSVSGGSGSSNSSSTGSNSSSTSSSSGSLGAFSSSSSSSSSSSGFAEIINTSTMTMTVAFSESDISEVHVGQPATITMEALTGVELGARVTAISPVATTSDGVVSYNATLTLEQRNRAVRPGMSATASVITGQQRGVTVPNQAVTGTGSSGTVEVASNGKTVTRQVVVGMRGSDRSVILSGLRAGADLVVTITLPSLSSSVSTTSSSTGTLGGGLGGVGRLLSGGGSAVPFGGGGGSFGGGGGGFFRGGG